MIIKKKHIIEFSYQKHPHLPNDVRITGIVSRYKSSVINPTQHKVQLRFDANDNVFKNIIAYCDCKQRRRTAGGCGHIIAVLFYMIHRKSNTQLPVIHPQAIELGSNLTDCLSYNTAKRQRDVGDEKEDHVQTKKRKTYIRKRKKKK